ncbi:hypothetical protein [Sporosarcina koreensis]|uniref:hypothetical protein n=1 Tax=Sporosarcina koreensis TaxID=334735 RepID=UPI00058ACE9F|nr:hypothetical protein [Sporosarcina koreensis]
MKKEYWIAVLLAVVIFLAVLVIDRPDEEDPAEQYGTSEYTDPPGLTGHQLALNQLYVEIPYEKKDVLLTKRTTDSHVFVDVTDKDTEDVLYTYGESLGSGPERQVVREVPTKEGTVRLQMVVDIDPSAGKIQSVISSGADYDPAPDEVENEMVSTGSRSGEFPADHVEILSSLHLRWGTDRENLYEGFVIGVIGK